MNYENPNTKNEIASSPNQGDLKVANEISEMSELAAQAVPKLVFDGYTLFWKGNSPSQYTAFSGAANESIRESVKDFGPTVQGLFAVDPANIEELDPSDDWGNYRVKIEPYASTVSRMRSCFPEVRTGMYIHGGAFKGTHGCIELIDDTEEKEFFKKLKDYGTKIELEVCYVRERKVKYEAPACPYST